MCHPTTSNTKGKSNAFFECIICMNTFSNNVSLSHGTKLCNHQVCYGCIRHYFNGALKDTRYSSYDHIQCPSTDCEEMFAVTDTLLGKFFSGTEIDGWWRSALIKTCIVNKVYCPKKDCEGVFDADETHTQKCAFTECYECNRGFCIACQSAWHTEGEKPKVFDDKEALRMTLRKAEQSNWCRCPKCAYMVEKTNGCNNMQCRCGAIFCYRCGRSSCHEQCASFTYEKLRAVRSTMFAEQSTTPTF